MGSYFVRVRKTMWNLWYQSYKDGERSQDKVPALAYTELGFRLDMSALQARARCKQLNSERSLEQDKVRKSAERVTELKLLDTVLFPEADVTEFIEKLEADNFGSEQHLEKTISRFNFIQKMVISLKLTHPSSYAENSKRVYKYFLTEKVSVNYAKTLISLLNKWGKFVSRKHGKFYDDVKPPRGRERSAIAEAQKSKRGTNSERGVRIESDALTPEILSSIESKLSVEAYNWLYLSVWLGLRPEEVDSLADSAAYKLSKDGKLTVLSVYQTKLMSIEESKRWKHVPLIFPEQMKCLTIIKTGNFAQPLSKTIRKYAGDRITAYGGRKNFVDLCLDRNQNFVDIAAWMGHKDTSITFKVYKQRQLVRYSPVQKTKKGFKIV